MPNTNIKSSFTSVAEQIITFNANFVALMAQLNAIVTSNQSSIPISIDDGFGVISQINAPTIGFLTSELNRLSNNVNQIFNIGNSAGTLVQTGSSNVFQKVITVDLNREPNQVGSLNLVTTFQQKINWLLDNLLDPYLQVEIDMTGQLGSAVDIREILTRRYIVVFEADASGNVTPLGQSAINSFNSTFRNVNNIDINDFTYWLATTPGVINGTSPIYDENTLQLEPSQLMYDGIFSVLSVEEDTLNQKLYYVLDTLDYTVLTTGTTQKLATGDELIINVTNSSTRYSILEISTAQSEFRITVERIEGLDPIPVGVGTLKIYSPVVFNQKILVNVGFNERTVIFVKPMSNSTFLLAKNWSSGTGFYTNDLTLNSQDNNNGSSMQQFYTNNVNDFGALLQDLIAKKIPSSVGQTPAAPVLVSDNFQVVQNNKHLTDSPDTALLKQKNSTQKTLSAQSTQLAQAIQDKQKQLKITKFVSVAAQAQFNNELTTLVNKKASVDTQVTSVVNDILTQNNLTATSVINAAYSLRGFWTIPDPTIAVGSDPQQIIGFRIRYKRLNTSGVETPITQFKVKAVTPTGTDTNGAFSNWTTILTDVLQRVKNADGSYSWIEPSVSDAEAQNINQLDIPIQPGEQIQFQIKSRSEVGYPESPLESDWSNLITFNFPTELTSLVSNNTTIVQDAQTQNLKASIQSDLSAKGLDEVLNSVVTVNNTTYLAASNQVISGFKDSNGNSIDLYTYLQTLQNQIQSLQEQINNTTGILTVILNQNNNPTTIKNGSDITYNIECEDYLDNFSSTDPSVPTGRVYANNIYVIKDFVLQVQNTAVNSPLQLLSNRIYNTNSDFYNTSAPQVFFVNNQNELLFDTTTGATLTQLNNQFIWAANFDNANQTTVVKLAENIGNNFVTSNSLTNYLSLTEYNLGFNDTGILSFIGNDNSLLDQSKWIDTTISVSSTSRFLTTIHPVVDTLQTITETNSEKIHSVSPGPDNYINIPINIYFKLNALDQTSSTGANYQYVNFNSMSSTVRHVKKVKFFMENKFDNRPFVFTINFALNRNKVVINKTSNTKISAT